MITTSLIVASTGGFLLLGQVFDRAVYQAQRGKLLEGTKNVREAFPHTHDCPCDSPNRSCIFIVNKHFGTSTNNGVLIQLLKHQTINTSLVLYHEVIRGAWRQWSMPTRGFLIE